MSRSRRQQIDRIYARALDLDAAERDAYLVDACADGEMRKEVQALVDAALKSTDELESQFDAIRDKLWSELVHDDMSGGEDLAGQQVGRWRIGERLARGGLATVYVAYRDDGEFDQKVAFKVLRRGLDTDDVVARFRAERQILSALDHPAIAKILDGGALPDGRPYLLLEYVDGESITTWCAQHDTSVRDRVKLMIDVLHALQHAHRHTIVHRDIKPSNILVSSEGNVVLLDFGIAKLLDPDALPGSSTLTRTGVSLLTPGYGSPEQHAGDAVTTASDIYQAGVLLYELLSGHRPDFRDENGQAAMPSRHLKGTRTYAALCGDLDAIVGKAMHVDPERRYASANEMVADLERYLDGRAVLAQPDTVGYRLRKLTKRRPWLLPTVAVFALGLSGYIVTLVMYSNELLREQQRAEAAQSFLVNLLGSADPYAPADPERGRAITVVEALDIGSRRLDVELANQPELKAELLESIAGVYSRLDQPDEAIRLGEGALTLNRELYGERSEPVLRTMRLLAGQHDARGDYDPARRYYEQQLDLARELYEADSPLLGIALVNAGRFVKRQGDIEAGLKLLMSGIEKLRRAPDENAEALINALTSVTEQDGMADASKTLVLLDEALAVANSAYGPDSLHAAAVRINIGRDALYVGDLERSDQNYGRALRIFEDQLGRDHSDTIAAKQDYAVQLNVTGQHARAEAIFREVGEALRSLYGEQHRDVADNYQNLATTITYQGRFDESLPYHRKAYDIYSAELPDHYIVAFPLLSIASIEVERGNSEAGLQAADEAARRLRATIPDSYPEGVALCLKGLALEQLGQTARGGELILRSHPLILKRDVLVPKYVDLCRVPVPDQQATG